MGGGELNSKINSKIHIDNSLLSLFLALFVFVYGGINLLLFLPEAVLNSSVITFKENAYQYEKNEYVWQSDLVAANSSVLTSGIVAGTTSAVIRQRDEGILTLLLKIPENFFKSLFASLTL